MAVMRFHPHTNNNDTCGTKVVPAACTNAVDNRLQQDARAGVREAACVGAALTALSSPGSCACSSWCDGQRSAVLPVSGVHPCDCIGVRVCDGLAATHTHSGHRDGRQTSTHRPTGSRRHMREYHMTTCDGTHLIAQMLHISWRLTESKLESSDGDMVGLSSPREVGRSGQRHTLRHGWCPCALAPLVPLLSYTRCPLSATRQPCHNCQPKGPSGKPQQPLNLPATH